MTGLAKSLALAAAGGALISITPGGGPDMSDETLARLDPSRQAATLCGNKGPGASTLRSRLMLLASNAAFAAVPEGSASMPLLEGMGRVHFPITTSKPLAQRYFDQGLTLAYGFNHAAAIRSFREAQRLDPGCAMCWWGEALAHGPNINAPMDASSLGETMAALQRAQTLAGRAQPAERALIAALATRYSADPEADRPALDMLYANAMLDAAKRYPEDDQIALLAAEAAMDTRPWDYWEADGRTPKGRIGEAIALVDRVLAHSPDHPQAAHLQIHLMEASINPKRAEAAADRLAAPLVPAAGHLVHMPAHIYYRLGRWQDSIKANVAAARADEAFFRSGGGSGLYRYGYYPHNVHFIVTSAQMAGDMGTAIREARRLSSILDAELASKVAWVQPITAAPYLAYAQFAPPRAVLALGEADKRLPYVAAMRRYARATAYARERDRRGFGAELAALRAIRDGQDFQPMMDQGVPARDLLNLADAAAQARFAYASGRYDEAIRLYQQAAAIEDQLPYMEPPFWYYPVHQSLGAALYRAGRYDEARNAFMKALAEAPNNGWALYGLAATERAQGRPTQAAAADAALERAWLGDRRWLTMDRL
ncbi:tetratricopeptide repeat protein [Sphingosinicella humi]|uniref:Tetratricopeptide repeat protein n=1 Tax=Allosphingosinicella humi TaxID=2068657 RepID=A0A2U2J167_9SPHN|nr:tetratricopeptide repeat protein [Sphingosinicella humi]PWG02057.1 hypothetical protein DF286_03605 [Sphingosinicella humi]